jgi:restriction system protein
MTYNNQDYFFCSTKLAQSVFSIDLLATFKERSSEKRSSEQEASEPRIKVQVKHKPDSAVPVNDIRSLMGLLSNKIGEIGLFVTSGRFTPEAEKVARDSSVHVRLINFDSFIQLWQQFYDALTDEEKDWLPLYKIYFLGSNE